MIVFGIIVIFILSLTWMESGFGLHLPRHLNKKGMQMDLSLYVLLFSNGDKLGVLSFH